MRSFFALLTFSFLFGFAVVAAALWHPSAAWADDLAPPPGVTNSQNPLDIPLPPTEALKKITVAEGFQVSLFAGEPVVRQPIAFAIDDRGRLWVAECYAYRDWKPEGNDRILILEDTTGDGQFNSRKVFWNKGNYISGIELGFGGVYVCSSPHVYFIPDRDGDDVPDGEPEILLDGWSTKGVHNMVNGLTWGPDGWLYGCNGITSPSRVGKPGTPDEERVDIACGIWRYHPTRHEFEVVAHGTTNPWGLDFDQHGQGFFINCVIGHFWHLIPGAHYKRMFGQDYNLQTFELIDQHADHLHWTGNDWTKTRGGVPEQLALGGGHAHSGAMIYLGDNWPGRYRNAMFTCNVHGARVNMDLIQRSGSGYVATHAPDVFLANDPWFRGVELKYGPDGGVYITDWTDLGECHDQDGVHRDSGRIYKMTYGTTTPIKNLNVARQPDDELLELLRHRNQWHVRHARRVLQERAAAETLSPDVVSSLQTMLGESQDPILKLESLWTLHVIGAADESLLVELLADDSEQVRIWAIRLLCESRSPAAAVRDRFSDMAANDSSKLVRLELASCMQRLPLEQRWPLAERLLAHEEDSDDPNLPLMIWYGIEPAVAADRAKAVALTTKCQIRQVRQFIVRRLATK